MEIISFNLDNRKLMKKFVKFPWILYKDDPYYVPKLNMEYLGSKLLGQIGYLTPKHPFHRNVETIYFLAYEGKEVVGRISGCINPKFNEQTKSKSAVFGFFESINDEKVAKALLDKVWDWGKYKGMDRIVGPMSYTANDLFGMQIDAFETLPYFETVHNPEYYPELMDKCGMKKEVDVIAQIMEARNIISERFERLKKITDKLKEKHKISVRIMDFKNFERDKEIFRDIYNDAWSENWGETGIDKDEFDLAAKNFKLAADPNIILLGFVEDEPAAALLAMPDVFDCIKRKFNFFDRFDIVRSIRLLRNKKKTDRVRLLVFGVKQKYRKYGFDAVMYYEAFKGAGMNKQYKTCEISWLLETNLLVIRAGESMSAKKYKTWRIYEKKIK